MSTSSKPTLGMNQKSFWYFFDGHDDLTSNFAKSLNSKVNSNFTAGTKTMASVCRTLHTFKWHHMHERIRALKLNEARYLRKRDKATTERWEKRRELVTHFYNLEPDQKHHQLFQTLLSLGELGVAPPPSDTDTQTNSQ